MVTIQGPVSSDIDEYAGPRLERVEYAPPQDREVEEPRALSKEDHEHNQRVIKQLDRLLVSACVLSLLYVAVVLGLGELSATEADRQLAETRATAAASR